MEEKEARVFLNFGEKSKVTGNFLSIHFMFKNAWFNHKRLYDLIELYLLFSDKKEYWCTL